MRLKLLKYSTAFLGVMGLAMNSYGQGMAVNTSGAAAAASAILDVSSTSQGMLIPRMTSTQRGAIATPVKGLLVYQTDAPEGFYFHNGSTWSLLGGGAPSGAAGGDLSGTYPNPDLAASGVTANTYGSASEIPVIGVDAKGRVTSASNTSISIAASQVTSGTINAARLGTGATGSNFLKSDGTWATPSGGGGGGVNHAFSRTTTNYTVLVTDEIVSYEGSSSSVSITLPSASSFGTGHILYIFNNTTASTPGMTIIPQAGDQIANLDSGGFKAAGASVSATKVGYILASDGSSKWMRLNQQ